VYIVNPGPRARVFGIENYFRNIAGRKL